MLKIENINFYTLACGFLSFVLGALVVYGWYIDNISLIQVSPSFAPMPYNTALCFGLSGIGLCALALNSIWIVRVLGLVTAAIGITTLAEYTFGH